MQTETVYISFGKQILICEIQYYTYRPETYLQPAEGGVADFELVKIIWEREYCINTINTITQTEVTALLMELAPDLINEKILEELNKF